MSSCFSRLKPFISGALLLGALASSAFCAEQSRESQRKLFKAIEPKVAEQPQLLEKHREALADYPLLPYLEASVLSWRFGRADNEAIHQFVNQFPGAPFAELLRTQWLTSLKNRKADTEFLTYYRPRKGEDLRCHYLNLAVKRTAHKEAALKEYHEWWMSGKDIPSSCQIIDKEWQSFGGTSESYLWTRIEQAIRSGNITTAQKLKAMLPRSDRADVDTWIKVRSNPKLILNAQTLAKSGERKHRITAFGLERLAWRDRDEALAAFQQLATNPDFPEPLRIQVQKEFAIALATAAHPAASGFLASIPVSLRDERLSTWRIIEALRRMNWQDADYWMSQLSSDESEQDRWRYFNGRSLAAQGHTLQAVDVWQPLADELSYYGFLARAQLGQKSTVSAPSFTPKSELVANMRQHSAIQRAYELLALGRIVPARREWQAMLDSLNADQIQAAAYIAHEWGWDDRAIFSLAKTQTSGAWEIRFPTTHNERLNKEAEKHDLHPTWAFAITRQESAFMTDAKSPAGALGLMQLMPSTASLTARRHKIRYGGSGDLISPAQNIKIGVAHLADLIDINDGNFVYATAAYNAGQGRVNQWRKRYGELPLDIWIETIPFDETQQYVKNVMAYSLIYAGRLEQNTDVFDYLTKQIEINPAPVRPVNHVP